MSPFFLNRGRERKGEIHGQLLHGLELPPPESEHIKYSELQEAEQEEIEGDAQKRNEQSQQQLQEGHKNTSRWLPAVGSLVMVKRPLELVESKLDPPNNGPFKVMSIDQHGNCILGSMDDKIPYVTTAPMSRFSRFRGTARGGQEYLPSNAIDIKALLTDPKKKMRSVGKMLGKDNSQ
jgi:hypothetical protein